MSEFNDDIESMIGDCEDTIGCSNHPFTKWDLDFIDSVSEQWHEKGSLSEKQIQILTKIWEKI